MFRHKIDEYDEIAQKLSAALLNQTKIRLGGHDCCIRSLYQNSDRTFDLEFWFFGETATIRIPHNLEIKLGGRRSHFSLIPILERVGETIRAEALKLKIYIPEPRL